MTGGKGPKDAIGDDGPQGNNSGKNEIRKRFMTKNGFVMDRPPGQSEPMDGTIIKSQGMFKTTWSSCWKSY